VEQQTREEEKNAGKEKQGGKGHREFKEKNGWVQKRGGGALKWSGGGKKKTSRMAVLDEGD